MTMGMVMAMTVANAQISVRSDGGVRIGTAPEVTGTRAGWKLTFIWDVSGHSNGMWNNEVGYGMVNAYAAVQAACQDVKVRNETISANKSVKSCGNVEFEDVIVKTGIKLSIDAPGEVVFGSGFEMEAGAELEMN